MADFGRRRNENAAGAFFVDEDCISCGACWKLAAGSIKSHELHTYAFFYRQPISEGERELCRAAKEICPVKAIGEARISEAPGDVPRT